MGEKLQFTELDQYLFGQGTHYDIYRKLGAHPTIQRRKKGVYFAVWAPNARSVSVVGEFNNWNTQANPMKKVGPIGVYETFIPGAKVGDLYKFYIIGYHGEELYKADPYGNESSSAFAYVSSMSLLVSFSIFLLLSVRFVHASRQTDTCPAWMLCLNLNA